MVRERINVVLTFGDSNPTKISDIGIFVPEYPKENPEYPGNSGLSGLKPGVFEFLWLQKFKLNFESIRDSICNRKN